MTRRRLLQALLAALTADPLSALARLGRRAHAAAVRVAQAVLDPELATGALSAPELENVTAFAEVLVEGQGLSPSDRQYLVEHVETRARLKPGYAALYRTTASLLDRLAGARFASLDAAQRIALMTRHRLTSPDVHPDENLGAFPDDVRAVRTRVVPDLIGGYYASPAGWAIVGYAVFPGRCGDLARYTGPER